MSTRTESLNGWWEYRVGKGEACPVSVPFSRRPVGHSECEREFELTVFSEKVYLRFDGITYHAKVWLNDKLIGEMLPYCEYTFDITDTVQMDTNCLRVELEDISPAFGPSEGWENFGGIIRDVNLVYTCENHIEDVFFHTRLLNGYRDAVFTAETKSVCGRGRFDIRLYDGDTCVARFEQEGNGEYREQFIENVRLWSPETPNLYRLETLLVENGMVTDRHECMVGFREFICGSHHFILNGKPVFLRGVCKHEMVDESGHCPTEEQMRRDLEMIRETGANFVRLVHYPHNKRIVEMADEIGLMVSEEPGLWWSDTSHPEVSAGSLEVLRRTILRDRNHPSIVFWLCFNECRFTEKFLLDSARVCRESDPTRPVSGANCMSDEDTLKYYRLCGFDFYTMHPYAPDMGRAIASAEVLSDMPLLFTEWGGYYVYDNPKLMKEFLAHMHDMYLDGRLAGALFWEWSEVNDYNRGRPACIDGVLREGLVDKKRAPTAIYRAFCDAMADMDPEAKNRFWIEGEGAERLRNVSVLTDANDEAAFYDTLNLIREAEKAHPTKMRKRQLAMGPVIENADGFACVPLIIRDGESRSFDRICKCSAIEVCGLVSLTKGYPLSGEYGEKAAEMTVSYTDGTQDVFPLRNGIEITTVFELNGSTRIDPVAENAARFAVFGYDKNFERYIMNRAEFSVDAEKTVCNIAVRSCANGYALLIYDIGPFDV